MQGSDGRPGMFDESGLDNPVWHALAGPHRAFADPMSSSLAVRYDPEVVIFGAVEAVDHHGWDAVDRLIGRGGFVALLRDHVGPLPDRYREVFRSPVLQMVAGDLAALDDPAAMVELGPADVDDMVDLTGRTRPGPFQRRTHELGRYLGVRIEGSLVAMAGERFRLPGATEISAVCTDEAVRGQGLGAALTASVARHITARGDVAFLHVEESNAAARSLYERLGFTVRRVNEVVVANRGVGYDESAASPHGS